jgi:hypothetical protein
MNLAAAAGFCQSRRTPLLPALCAYLVRECVPVSGLQNRTCFIPPPRNARHHHLPSFAAPQGIQDTPTGPAIQFDRPTDRRSTPPCTWHGRDCSHPAGDPVLPHNKHICMLPAPCIEGVLCLRAFTLSQAAATTHDCIHTTPDQFCVSTCCSAGHATLLQRRAPNCELRVRGALHVWLPPTPYSSALHIHPSLNTKRARRSSRLAFHAHFMPI